VRDHLSAQGFGAEVCRYDVNGNGTDDFLAVYQSHLRPGAVEPPAPGGVRPAENVTAFERGLVIAAFTLQTLDAVVKLRNGAQTGQAEHVYVRMFDKLYEVPISSVADCRGSLESDTYRTCLMKGFFTREKTQAFPTLPGCPAEERQDSVSPSSQEGRGSCDERRLR
jgi:hypothetical protein